MKRFEITNGINNPESSAIQAEQICHDAWLRSEWVRGLARNESTSANQIAGSVFDKNKPQHIARNLERIEASKDSTSNTVLLLGSLAVNQKPKGMVQLIPEYDFTDRSLQTSKPDYICIQRLAVERSAARSKLASALVYSAMDSVNKTKQVSFFTAYDNMAMRKWGELYGFTADTNEEYQQTFTLEDAVGDEKIDTTQIKVPTLRYVCESGALLQDNIRENNPELFS